MSNIFIATCRGCGAKILVWYGSSDAICHRCQQREEQQRGLGKYRGLGRWSGGGLLFLLVVVLGIFILVKVDYYGVKKGR